MSIAQENTLRIIELDLARAEGRREEALEALKRAQALAREANESFQQADRTFREMRTRVKEARARYDESIHSSTLTASASHFDAQPTGHLPTTTH